MMQKRNEQGYAIILLLALTAVLMIFLTGALGMMSALRTQNRYAKIELAKKEARINKVDSSVKK